MPLASLLALLTFRPRRPRPMPTAASISTLLRAHEIAEPGISRMHLADAAGRVLLLGESQWRLATCTAAALGGWNPEGTDAPETFPREPYNGDPTERPAGTYFPTHQRMTAADARALGAGLRRAMGPIATLPTTEGAEAARHPLPYILASRGSVRDARVELIQPARSLGLHTEAVGGRLADWLAAVEGPVQLRPGVPSLLPPF